MYCDTPMSLEHDDKAGRTRVRRTDVERFPRLGS